jgi:hypothetical protein
LTADGTSLATIFAVWVVLRSGSDKLRGFRTGRAEGCFVKMQENPRTAREIRR